MSSRGTEHLRVLIADERKDRLALVASTRVVPLGRLAACPAGVCDAWSAAVQ